MYSINLLPEGFIIESYRKREKIAIYILAIFFLLSSFVTFAIFAFGNDDIDRESDLLDEEISKVKNDIENETKESELFFADYSRDDIKKLTDEHLYLSKSIDFLKSVILKDVYLSQMKVVSDDETGIKMSIELDAKDYASVMNQIAVLKDSFWVESVDFSNIEMKENSEASASGDLILRKDLFTFHEQYWDFGIEKLASEVDRDVKITAYSIVLKKTKNEISGYEDQQVQVTFEGITYDIESLDNFEKRIRNENITLESLDIFKKESSVGIPGVMTFNGNMIFSY
ncbi:MAG: hypothetical protein WC178_00265 [Candidatus Paceibacterota bacterium]